MAGKLDIAPIDNWEILPQYDVWSAGLEDRCTIHHWFLANDDRMALLRGYYLHRLVSVHDSLQRIRRDLRVSCIWPDLGVYVSVSRVNGRGDSSRILHIEIP